MTVYKSTCKYDKHMCLRPPVRAFCVIVVWLVATSASKSLKRAINCFVIYCKRLELKTSWSIPLSCGCFFVWSFLLFSRESLCLFVAGVHWSAEVKQHWTKSTVINVCYTCVMCRTRTSVGNAHEPECLSAIKGFRNVTFTGRTLFFYLRSTPMIVISCHRVNI